MTKASGYGREDSIPDSLELLPRSPNPTSSMALGLTERSSNHASWSPRNPTAES